MALFIEGRSTCPLCREVIEREDVELFPPGIFLPNEDAFVVNDAPVHRACLLAHPWGRSALERRDDRVAAVSEVVELTRRLQGLDYIVGFAGVVIRHDGTIQFSVARDPDQLERELDTLGFRRPHVVTTGVGKDLIYPPERGRS